MELETGVNPNPHMRLRLFPEQVPMHRNCISDHDRGWPALRNAYPVVTMTPLHNCLPIPRYLWRTAESK